MQDKKIKPKKQIHISIDADEDKIQLEKRRKEIREKIAKYAFNEENERLKKRAYTSFGKLILATEKTNPIYGIGTADRFNSSSGFLQNIKTHKNFPAPNAYNTTDPEFYKYKTSSKWKIGKSERKPLNTNERYSYFNHKYEEKDDLSKIPKKWNKPLYGIIGTEPRIKYNFRETTPGPGRYDPTFKNKIKYPSYYLGEKTKFNDPLYIHTGTNKNVGPGKYNIDPSDKLRSTWTNLPKYSIGNGKRKELGNKKWTKNETYYMYSSFGDQIQTKKRSEPRTKEGKSTRFIESKRGVFKSMMERQPVSIRIAMPKF